MNIFIKKQKAFEILDQEIEELNSIVKKVYCDRDTDSGFERIKRWKERASRLLDENIHPNEGAKFRSKRMGVFTMGQPLLNFEREAKMYVGFLKALREEIEKYPEHILSVPTPNVTQNNIIEIPAPPSSKDIFIIHGHDELNLLRLKELLKERWRINSIVLNTKAGKGRTLIEKFEQEAESAAFVIVLFTPDDLIFIPGKNEYAQARPNVIFELGWFYGRLGRNRVCILFKKGTKIHSDLDGVSRIEFNESIQEKIAEIEKELLAAGLLNKK